MSVDNARLVQRAKEGDANAFVEIYDWYQPVIYRYILYRVESIGMAEGLTGDIFVRLVESIDRFSHRDASLAPRLYSLAEELVAERQRHSESDSVLSPNELAEQRLPPQCLAPALTRLTDDQRRVVLLRFIEGLDDEAAARMLGKPVDVIQELQQQALTALVEAIAWCDAAQISPSVQRHRQDMERLLGDGIQNLAHELRTPLNLVHGYAELLLSNTLGPLDSEQRDAVQIICDGAETLSGLIRNLTLLRSIPRKSLNLTPVSVPELLASTVERSRIAAEQAGIHLEIRAADDLPSVLGAQDHLKVALSQMLDNAIKFSPGGGQVTVRAWIDDRRWLRIAVQDQGTGIAPEHLDKIFDRFYQVDSSPTRRFGGAGIGLNVVRAVAEAHGGQVWAASEGVGKGSTFTLTLPVQSPASMPLSSQPLLGYRPLLGRYLDRVLDEYLSPLEDGRVTLEDCLARYPEYAADLRPLVEIALEIRSSPRPASGFAAFAAGKRRMLDALAEKRRKAVPSSLPARQVRPIAVLLEKWKYLLAPRRAPVLRPVMAGVLALLALLLAGQIFRSLAGGAVPRTAALIQVGGAVQILPTGEAAWRQASLGERVEGGDRIRTGALSSVRLRFFDGSITDLDAETDVTIAQARSQRDGSGKVIVLHQWIGQTFNSVEPLTDAASRFQVETPAAVMAVRGTRFQIVVDAGGDTSVAVIEGVVDVTDRDSTVAMLAGEETTILHEPPVLADSITRIFTPVPTLMPAPSLLYLVSVTPRWTSVPAPSETVVTPEILQQTNTPRPKFVTPVLPGGGGEPAKPPTPTQVLLPTATSTLRPTPTRSRPTPTPAPTDTPTPCPTPTLVPTDTPTPILTSTPVLTGTLTPTATLTPTGVVSPTVETTP